MKKQLKDQTQIIVDKQKKADELKESAVEIIKKSDPNADSNDTKLYFSYFHH